MAGIMINATLLGADNVLRKFARLDRGVAGPITKGAVREGIKPQLRTARATDRFQDRTGKLRRRMGTSVRTKQRGLLTIGRVLVRQGARHAMPVEYGHRIAIGGTLKRRDGKPRKLKFGQKTGGVSGGFVPGRHYMRQAFQDSQANALNVFTREFVDLVQQAVS